MKPIIAANWKMHKTRSEVESFFNDLKVPSAVSVWIAPSATTLHFAAQQTTSILIGVQNIYFEPQGAFTGEISAAQVADCGARFVIIGHSERRRLFGENNPQIKKKVAIASAHNLIPLLCVGETLEERNNHQTRHVLETQLQEVLTENFNGVIAYEPVWAIGTGQTATPEMIEEAHTHIKKILEKMTQQGAKTAVLYGGSVTPQTAPQLSQTKNVDGALVGGASLEAPSFMAIIKGFIK